MKTSAAAIRLQRNIIAFCILLLFCYAVSVICKNKRTGTSGSPNINPPNRPTWLGWLIPQNELTLPERLIEQTPAAIRDEPDTGPVNLEPEPYDDEWFRPQPTPEQPTPEPPDGEPHNGETRRLLYRRVNRRRSRGPQLSWYFPYKYL